MRIEHYFAIGLKLLSIVLFVYGVSFTPTVIETLFYGSINGLQATITYFVFSLGLCWGLAFVLWFFPLKIAHKFLPPNLNQSVEPLATPSILAVFVIAIGLYVFAFGVIDILYWGVYMHLAAKNTTFSLGADGQANIVATLSQLVFGLLLIYKSRSISNLINKVAS